MAPRLPHLPTVPRLRLQLVESHRLPEQPQVALVAIDKDAAVTALA
jgi:hypothetical protein